MHICLTASRRYSFGLRDVWLSVADLPRGYYPNQSPVKSRGSPGFGHLDEHPRWHFHRVRFPLGAEYASQVCTTLARTSLERALNMRLKRL